MNEEMGMTKPNAECERNGVMDRLVNCITPIAVFLALTALFFTIGCSEQHVDHTGTPGDEIAQADQAKAHVQQYVDQLLGGNLSVQEGLLGLDGVGFTVESIEVVSSLPKYLPDGELVKDCYTVKLKAKGFDRVDRSVVEKNINRTLYFQDGKWRISGTEL